jgi:RecA-family ATPase
MLPFINMSGWDTEPAPEREWAVLDRIPMRQPTLFSGEGSIGKSLVELQLCAAHVLGRSWLGTTATQGAAIYVGCEDDKDELHRRMADIATHYQTTFMDLIKGGLHLVSLAGEETLLCVPDKSGKLAPTPLFNKLVEAAGDIKPKHIGIDTSADVFGGNEIDRGQVRQFIGMLRKLAMTANGAVVLLSHPSLQGINSGTGLSGSTGWHNSVRARMFLQTPRAKEGEQPDTDLRELEFKKNNYARLSEKIVLRYRNGVFDAETTSSFDKAARDQRIDEVFLAVIAKLIEQNRPTSPSPNASNYGPKVVAEHPDGKAYLRAEYVQAMERCLGSDRLHVVTFGPKTRPLRSLALGPKNTPPIG